MINQRLKIARGNARLGLAMAMLGSNAVAHSDPLLKTGRELRALTPAQRMKEQRRRENLATQIAKKALKKS